MKVLVFSTVFPSHGRPVHGLFVFERIRHAANHASVRVVAPIEWFRRGKKMPRREIRGQLNVELPTFFYIPGLFKCLDGVFLFLSTVVCVARIRQRFDFELIDSHFAFPDGFAAVLLGWWFRRPVCVTLRGSEMMLSTRSLRRLAIAWTLRRANRIVAVSQSLASFARDVGVPAERIAVIENGVDATRFRVREKTSARTALDTACDLGSAGPVLLSVGRVVPGKGVHRVVHLLPELVKLFPNLLYVVVGETDGTSGNYRSKLQQLVERFRLRDHVLFTGAQSPDQVAHWFSAADVFVLPTEREGSPNVVWEALASGRPVVATRVGEIEQMVPPYAGILMDAGDNDARLHVCLEAAIRKTWDTDAIRTYAEKHTWDGVAARVAQQWRLVTSTAVHSAAICGARNPAGRL